MSTTELLSFALPWAAWICSAVALAPIVHGVLSVPALPVPLHGERGRRRRMALAEGRSPSLQRVLSWLGARLRMEALAPLCARADRHLSRASFPGGLWPEELLAACVLACAAALACCCCLADDLVTWLPISAVVGLGLPWLRVRESAKARALALERGLPAAMDLCVLCMGAGADFPTAIRFVVEELDSAHPVCTEELAMVLEELSLGRTRLDALASMGQRTESEAVRDFVAAVCQSEQKGTPVGEALSLQATAIRLKRSAKAEELAAKTAVRLTLPLMMTLVCVMSLLFGPFIARGGL